MTTAVKYQISYTFWHMGLLAPKMDAKGSEELNCASFMLAKVNVRSSYLFYSSPFLFCSLSSHPRTSTRAVRALRYRTTIVCLVSFANGAQKILAGFLNLHS
ncbi:hypothetical protein Plhal304r1_c054g0139151 [Plasmopara halstedii]